MSPLVKPLKSELSQWGQNLDEETLWMWNRKCHILILKDIFIFFSQSKMVLWGGNYLVSLSNCCFIMRLYKEFCPILISFGLSRSSSTIILIIVRCEIAWELYMHVCLQLENESFSFLFFITFKNKYIVCKRDSAELAYLDYAVKYEIPQLILVFDIAWWQLFE